MTYEAIHNAIRSHFKNEVVNFFEQDGVKAEYDNVNFVPPDDGKIWLALNIVPGESLQVSTGRPARFRRPGVAMISIFAPLNTGDKKSLVIVDRIFDKFKPGSLSSVGITCRTPTPVNVGNHHASRRPPLLKWHQTVVNCPFFADHIPAT